MIYNGECREIWTLDNLIKSQVLYLLSYTLIYPSDLFEIRSEARIGEKLWNCILNIAPHT